MKIQSIHVEVKVCFRIDFGKVKLCIKTLEATWCNSLQANSVEGALLCDHNTDISPL